MRSLDDLFLLLTSFLFQPHHWSQFNPKIAELADHQFFTHGLTSKFPGTSGGQYVASVWFLTTSNSVSRILNIKTFFIHLPWVALSSNKFFLPSDVYFPFYYLSHAGSTFGCLKSHRDIIHCFSFSPRSFPLIIPVASRAPFSKPPSHLLTGLFHCSFLSLYSFSFSFYWLCFSYLVFIQYSLQFTYLFR